MPTQITVALPTSGQAQWDSPLNEVLQQLIDAVEANITVDGLDITDSLSLQGNALVDVTTLEFVSTADAGTAYSLFYGTNGELYARDGANNLIQLTSNGTLNISVNGGIGGDYVGSSAQIVYSSSGAAYTFTSSPGVYATMEVGEVHIHEGSTTSYVALKAPTGLSSNVSLNLPSAVPSARSIVTIDATGSLGWRTLSPGGTSIVTCDANGILNVRQLAPGGIGVVVCDATGTLNVRHSSSFSRALGPQSWAMQASSANVGAGTVPWNQGNYWTFPAGTDGVVVASLNMEPGETFLGARVYFDRVDTTTPNAPATASFSLRYARFGDRGGEKVAITQNATTGSTNTMAAIPTGSFVIQADTDYWLYFTGANTGSILFGAVMSGSRSILGGS